MVDQLVQGLGTLKCRVLGLPYKPCTLIFENVKRKLSKDLENWVIVHITTFLLEPIAGSLNRTFSGASIEDDLQIDENNLSSLKEFLGPEVCCFSLLQPFYMKRQLLC